jgi:WD40 repeat protein
VTAHSFRDCTADLHYVAAVVDDRISVTDTTTGTEVVVDGALPGAVAFSPDGSRLAASAQLAGGGIMLWEVASHRATTFATPNRLRHAFAFAPDGSKLVAASESALTVFDLATGASQDLNVPGEVLQLDGRPPGVVFDRAGQRLAAVVATPIPPRSSREDVMLWDLASGERRTIFGGHADSISFDDTGIDVLVGHATFTIADDLPHSPDALSERLRAEPYLLDPDTAGTLRIRLR